GGGGAGEKERSPIGAEGGRGVACPRRRDANGLANPDDLAPLRLNRRQVELRAILAGRPGAEGDPSHVRAEDGVGCLRESARDLPRIAGDRRSGGAGGARGNASTHREGREGQENQEGSSKKVIHDSQCGGTSHLCARVSRGGATFRP